MTAPRHFRRRALAFALDCIIFTILACLLLIPFEILFDNVRISPAVISINTCEQTSVVPDGEIRAYFPSADLDSGYQVLCRQQANLSDDLHFVEIAFSQRTAGDSPNNVRIRYWSDRNGNPRPLVDLSFLPVFALPVFLAALIAKDGTTPGKRFLDLHVVNDALLNPAFKASLVREAIKSLPALMPALVALAATLNNPTPQNASGPDYLEIVLGDHYQSTLGQPSLGWAITASIALLLAGLAFHLGSFVFWNGRAYWDRWPKLQVLTTSGILDRQTGYR